MHLWPRTTIGTRETTLKRGVNTKQARRSHILETTYWKTHLSLGSDSPGTGCERQPVIGGKIRQHRFSCVYRSFSSGQRVIVVIRQVQQYRLRADPLPAPWTTHTRASCHPHEGLCRYYRAVRLTKKEIKSDPKGKTYEGRTKVKKKRRNPEPEKFSGRLDSSSGGREVMNDGD